MDKQKQPVLVKAVFSIREKINEVFSSGMEYYTHDADAKNEVLAVRGSAFSVSQHEQGPEHASSESSLKM